MANNIAVTPGTGATIGAEEISSVLYGQVKLVDATVGSTSPIGVTANPLKVTSITGGLVGLDAGTNAIGKLTANSGVTIGDVNQTIATAGFEKITDGTTTNTLKAASTAPIATDTALVVALSPNMSTLAGSIAKAEDAAHTTGDVGVQMLGVRNDSNTTLTDTDLDYSPIAVDLAGRLKLSTLSGLAVAGDVASDAVDSGNPIKTGGIARTSDITAVVQNDRVESVYDITGKQVVLPFATPGNMVFGKTADLTTTSSATVITLSGSGLYITSLLVTNSHATVGTFVNVRNTNGSVVLYTGYAAPAGGGFSCSFPSPLKCFGGSFEALCETTGANVRVSAVGFTSNAS